MTSKTFESIDQTRQLHVKPLDKHVTLVINYKHAGRSGLTISHSDAPALALAILEAAGVEASFDPDATYGTAEQLGHIQDHLHEYVNAQERAAAEAREQAELEAEALELLNAFSLATGGVPIDSFEGRSMSKPGWIDAARRAREMRNEKKEPTND